LACSCTWGGADVESPVVWRLVAVVVVVVVVDDDVVVVVVFVVVVLVILHPPHPSTCLLMTAVYGAEGATQCYSCNREL